MTHHVEKYGTRSVRRASGLVLTRLPDRSPWTDLTTAVGQYWTASETFHLNFAYSIGGGRFCSLFGPDPNRRTL